MISDAFYTSTLSRALSLYALSLVFFAVKFLNGGNELERVGAVIIRNNNGNYTTMIVLFFGSFSLSLCLFLNRTGTCSVYVRIVYVLICSECIPLDCAFIKNSCFFFMLSRARLRHHWASIKASHRFVLCTQMSSIVLTVFSFSLLLPWVILFLKHHRMFQHK